MGITPVFDATHANIASLPAGQTAGYVTGTPDIAWTNADFGAHPGAIRIDQSPSSGVWDATADVDDFETGAVELSELAPRAKLRRVAFENGTRPGQRSPLVYVSASNVHQVANALVNGGVTSGVGLWLADWNLTEPQAIADITAASGPFPIEGVQFFNAGSYDISVFNSAWLNTVSGKASPTYNQFGWRFCNKCSSLVHATGPGICAGGGVHDMRESHNYSVSWNDSVA
jgi:hypothetical protein